MKGHQLIRRPDGEASRLIKGKKEKNGLLNKLRENAFCRGGEESQRENARRELRWGKGKNGALGWVVKNRNLVPNPARTA